MSSFWLLVQQFWTNFMTIVGLKRLNKVILAPILAPSFFKFWKRYSQIFTFFYVRAEHHWKKARARWAAFRTELANTAKANWKTWNSFAGQLQWPAVRLKLGNSQKPTKKPEVFSRLSWNQLRINWNDLRQLKTDFFSRATCIDRLVIIWHSDVK